MIDAISMIRYENYYWIKFENLEFYRDSVPLAIISILIYV